MSKVDDVNTASRASNVSRVVQDMLAAPQMFVYIVDIYCYVKAASIIPAPSKEVFGIVSARQLLCIDVQMEGNTDARETSMVDYTQILR